MLRSRSTARPHLSCDGDVEAISGASRGYGAGLIAARGSIAPSRPATPRRMGVSAKPPSRARRVRLRHVAIALGAVVAAGLLAFALSRLDLNRIGHALITATPGWIVLAFLLMALSLLLRAVAWHETLRAALPETPIPWAAVVRATMIGVMASAVFPGRVGEPTRVLVLARRLDGSTRRLLPIVAGTVVSQTLINLLALAILTGVTFTSVPLLHGHLAGLADRARGAARRRARSYSRAPPADGGRTLAPPRVVLASQSLARILSLARRGPDRVRAPPPRSRHDRRPAAGVGGAVAGLLRGDTRARPADACQPRDRRRDPARGERQRDPARDAVQRGRLPGRLPGGARRIRCRRGRGPRLRHHPAGGRDPDRARAGHSGPARRGPDLAGHPPRQRSPGRRRPER